VGGDGSLIPARTVASIKTTTVPESIKTDEFDEIVDWLGETVRQTDSSLLDEWEQLRDPSGALVSQVEAGPPAVTRNVRAFRVLVRNALFRRVELAALGHYDELGQLDADDGWDAEAWAGPDAWRVWLKSEGNRDKSGQLTDGQTEAMVSKPIAPFWDVQVGARYDLDSRPGRACCAGWRNCRSLSIRCFSSPAARRASWRCSCPVLHSPISRG